jgi:hypothetical protein
MPAARRARTVVALYAFCMLYLVPVFPHFLSANELTRWAAVVGLVEHGSLEVSWAEPLIGPPMDVARSGSRLYSNKAPGITFLAVPAYLIARPIIGSPTRSNLRWSLTAMRIATVSLPAIALGLLLARRCREDSFAVASLLFGTPIFVYGALFFSHLTAAALLYGAFLLVLRDPGAKRPLLRAGVAGTLAGLATVTEYPAAIAVVLLGVAILSSADRWRRLAAFIAGGLPWALALAIYNRLLFGSIWSLSSGREEHPLLAAQAARGVFGVSAPTLDQLAHILLSPSRGLLFFSPILLLGIVSLWPRRGQPAAAWFRLAFFAALALAMGGYPMNHGGWGTGARYLILTLPFLVEAAHDRGVRPGLASAALLTASVVLCVAPALTFPYAPNHIRFLHASITRPLLGEGFATPNWGSVVAPGLASLAPVVLAAAAALALALAERPRRTIPGSVVGVIVAAAVIFAPVRETMVERATRALILDTHFTPAGRLASLARECSDPAERTQIEALAAATVNTQAVGPDGWPYRHSPD